METRLPRDSIVNTIFWPSSPLILPHLSFSLTFLNQLSFLRLVFTLSLLPTPSSTHHHAPSTSTSSSKLSGKGHKWIRNSQSLTHLFTHSSLSSVAHGKVKPSNSLDRLSSLGACDPTLSSPWLVYYRAYSQKLGLTPQDDFLYFSSLSRYCPYDWHYHLKSLTPVHADRSV